MKTIRTTLQTRTKQNPKDTRDGAAIVEMAVTFPIFMMVVLGIVEFGRAMMVANLLTNAAREGARMGIVSGVTNAEVENAVITQVQNTVGITITTSNIDIYTSAYPNGSPVLDGDLTTAQKRDLIEVEVRALYSSVSSFPLQFLSGVSLRGQAAMRHE